MIEIYIGAIFLLWPRFILTMITIIIYLPLIVLPCIFFNVNKPYP